MLHLVARLGHTELETHHNTHRPHPLQAVHPQPQLAQAAAAAAAAACLLVVTPPAVAACENTSPVLEVAVPAVTEAAFADCPLPSPSSAPSLVASPLSGDATADLTAAVTQQVVAAALSPSSSAVDLQALDGLPLPLTEQLHLQQAQQHQGTMVEGIKAVVTEGIQGANLAESSMSAVG